MSRGKPIGSQYFMGSFDSASEYCEWFLWERNCSCPHGVMGGMGLSLALTRPAQKPVRSWRGAGPPLPVLDALSYKVLPSSARMGRSACRFCDHACKEKSNITARPM